MASMTIWGPTLLCSNEYEETLQVFLFSHIGGNSKEIMEVLNSSWGNSILYIIVSNTIKADSPPFLWWLICCFNYRLKGRTLLPIQVSFGRQICRTQAATMKRQIFCLCLHLDRIQSFAQRTYEATMSKLTKTSFYIYNYEWIRNPINQHTMFKIYAFTTFFQMRQQM